MKKLTYAVILLPLSLLILITAFATVATAQSVAEEQGLSISPVVFELNADPGDVVTNQLKVINPTDNPISVAMKLEDFYPVGQEGNVVLTTPDENDNFSVAKWTELTPQEFVLPAGQTQVVTMVMSVPEDAEPGGHYGSVVASTSGGDINGGGSIVGSDRGALILMRVSGDIVEEVAVEGFTAVKQDEAGPVDFSVVFYNSGNVHLRPAGFINITDIFGNQVAQLELPQNNVIPEARRRVETEWERDNLFGRYTATLVVNYGNEAKQTLTETVTFSAFPVTTILIIIGVVFALLIVIYLGRNRIKLAAKVLAGKHS